MNVLIGVAAGLASAVLFAVRAVGIKKAIEKTGLWQAFFYIYLASWIPALAYYLLSGSPAFTQMDLLYGAIVGLGLVAGYYLFYKAVDVGLVSLAGPIGESWAVFTVIAAFFFLGERLNLIQGAGVLVAFAGIFAMALKGRIETKGVHYAIAASLVWGFTWFLVKPLVDSAGVINAYVLYEGVGVIVIAAYLLFFGKFSKPDSSTLLPGVFQAAAYLIEDVGIMLSTVSLVSVVFAPAYVVSVLAVSKIFLKEKIQKRHYAGIAMILAGIVLVSIG